MFNFAVAVLHVKVVAAGQGQPCRRVRGEGDAAQAAEALRRSLY
jgi:hypothetical protein